MRKSILFSISMMILLAVASSACSILAPGEERTEGPTTPTMNPLEFQATLDMAATQAVKTFEAMLTQTAEVQATQMVVISPTFEPTFTPTQTPTETPTATATHVPPTATMTQTPTPKALDCQIVSESPAPGTKMSPGFDFDAVWTVKNTGTQKWELGIVDIRYDSGEKMQKFGDAFDIAKTVNPSEQVTITIDMLAPLNAGSYKAIWKLVQDSNLICTMSVSIEVTAP